MIPPLKVICYPVHFEFFDRTISYVPLLLTPDLGDYHLLDDEKTTKVMRPSEPFNKTIDQPKK
ncbi:hypothetical protein [Corynebacterium cystitidis]|nr:hypothetical protein [Corynebacterium cystitidis]